MPEHFEFRPAPKRMPNWAPKRWLVWWWDPLDECWHHAPAPMPEGAAATYADISRRHAGAICMEAE